MKKIVLVLLTLVTANHLMADNRVTSGDANILNDASAAFNIVFDFSNTIVEDVPYKEYLASRNADWNRDWPSDQKEGINSFIKKWNKKNKKGLQATTMESAPYTLVIKPTSIHFGSAALSWVIGFGAGGMKMSGTLDLYKGDSKVLSIAVEEQTGKSANTETQRFKSLMEELAEDALNDIKK